MGANLDSAWYTLLFIAGYQFETPSPEITGEEVKRDFAGWVNES